MFAMSKNNNLVMLLFGLIRLDYGLVQLEFVIIYSIKYIIIQ